jgi:drug/metabolite transporter (DMT)-like permease
MPTEVMLLVLLGALCHAGWNASIRAAADRFAQMVAITLSSALIAATLAPFLPLPAPESWPYLAASVSVHFIYFLLVAYAYDHGELSVSYPLMRGTAPLLTAVGAVVLLREALSGQAWLALLLLCGGVLLLATERGARGAVVFALANACVIALYTVLDGQGGRLAGEVWSYTLWIFLVNAVPFLGWVLLVPSKRRHLRPMTRAWWRGLLGGALAVASYGLAVWAMTQAPVALVAALREAAVIFGLLIGVVFLRERFGPLRWLAAGLVVLGAAALRLA